MNKAYNQLISLLFHLGKHIFQVKPWTTDLKKNSLIVCSFQRPEINRVLNSSSKNNIYGRESSLGEAKCAIFSQSTPTKRVFPAMLILHFKTFLNYGLRTIGLNTPWAAIVNKVINVKIKKKKKRLNIEYIASGSSLCWPSWSDLVTLSCPAGPYEFQPTDR